MRCNPQHVWRFFMSNMEVRPIGTIACAEGEFSIVLNPEYAPALRGLDGYSHVQVVWWFDRTEGQVNLVEERPYVKGPDELGVFATRSPMRPNPIAVSASEIAYVDATVATVGLHYIDAYPGSPVLDLKPYTPSVDRVESPSVPDWCDHWPKSYEESGDFDWEAEFNF
jgi:tRNA-Thr(GGU) m(6)t(6)A37 methyltransferase TsaA